MLTFYTKVFLYVIIFCIFDLYCASTRHYVFSDTLFAREWTRLTRESISHNTTNSNHGFDLSANRNLCAGSRWILERLKYAVLWKIEFSFRSSSTLTRVACILLSDVAKKSKINGAILDGTCDNLDWHRLSCNMYEIHMLEEKKRNNKLHKLHTKAKHVK